MAIYQSPYYGQPYGGYAPQVQPQMPMMQQQIQPQMPQPVQQATQRNWVQGIAGAKSFLVAPGQTVDLWDSEDTVIYLKSADATGIPSMQILDYTIRSQAGKPQPLQQDDYVKRKELDNLIERVSRLEGGATNAEPSV